MRVLRKPYEVVPDPESTKSKILLESARLFALSGYSAVSMRDIASRIGINAGTIYTYFSSKKEILDTMMIRFEQELHEFYQLLDNLSYTAGSFTEILNNIFAEAKETTNPFSYYVIECAMNTQFQFETSRHLYYDVYFVEGHKAMRRQLEIAIERKLIQPFDVAEIASLITNVILTMNGFHIGYLNGIYQDFDIPKWYSMQINHILRTVGLPIESECKP